MNAIMISKNILSEADQQVMVITEDEVKEHSQGSTCVECDKFISYHCDQYVIVVTK